MTAARVPTPDDPGSPACTQVCRIVICDDQPELREAIGQILARNPHFAVVGQAHDGVSCLEQVEQTRPDLLILDVNMPAGGPHLAAAAKLIRPQLHIVVFSGRQDSATTTAMLTAGADQYVLKTGRVRPLVQALETAYGAIAMDQ
jgi:DNA-binding NarL/FixJ family response regulator